MSEIDELIDKLVEASREHGATWYFGQDDVETEAKANMQATRAALRAAIAAKDAENEKIVALADLMKETYDKKLAAKDAELQTVHALFSKVCAAISEAQENFEYGDRSISLADLLEKFREIANN
jgi:hypothetical protein